MRGRLSKPVAAALAGLALAGALAVVSTPASAGWRHRHYTYGYDHPLWPGYYWHPPYTYDDATVPIIGPVLRGIAAVTAGERYYDPPHAYYGRGAGYYGATPYYGYQRW